MTRKREHDHKVGAAEIFIRFVIPAWPLLIGIFLTWYGLSILSEDQAAAWPLIVLSVAIVIGSGLLIWYLNTEGMRARFRNYVIPDDESPGRDQHPES